MYPLKHNSSVKDAQSKFHLNKLSKVSHTVRSATIQFVGTASQPHLDIKMLKI